MKFSLEKAVGGTPKKEVAKRPTEEKQDTNPSRSKCLKVGQIIVEEGPKPQMMKQEKLSPNAAVIVVIHKVTDDAGFIWESYKGGEAQPLWQIQISHPTPRPITFQFKDRFADFLKNYAEAPNTLEELEEHGIRVVVSDSNDPDDIGYVQWRPALYVVGDLNNGMLLLDAFFVHISTTLAKEKSFDVHVTPHIGISIEDVWDELEYGSYTLNEANKKPPLSFYEMSPCFGKKVPSFSIEVASDIKISIVITQVFVYRDGFEAYGVQGGRMPVPGKDKGEYVRFMRDIDLTKTDQEDRVLNVIDKVLHNCALRVIVEGECGAECVVASFLAKLRERVNMFFVK